MNKRCKECGYEGSPEEFNPDWEGTSSDLDDDVCPECRGNEIEELD